MCMIFVQDVLDVLRKLCAGVSVCVFGVDNSAFSSDPCPGVSKYLNASFVCE